MATDSEQLDGQSKKSRESPPPAVEIAVPDDVQQRLSMVSQGKGVLFLMIKSRAVENEMDGPGIIVTFFRDLTGDRPAEVRHIAAPRPFGQFRLLNPFPREGGGQYLLLQHRLRPTDAIYIVDPFTSPTWMPRGVLPGCAPLSLTAQSILKAVTRKDSIVSGTIVLAIAQPYRELVWTAIGQHDRVGQPVLTHSGTPLEWYNLPYRLGNNPNLRMWFSDIIWCRRDNSFWALIIGQSITCTFDFSSACGGNKLAEAQVITLSLPPRFDYLAYTSDGWEVFWNGLFVDAPSALFVVRWEKATKKGEKVHKHLHVQKLIDNGGAEKRWENVTSLDGYSFFLGTNHSVALSAADFPGLRSNLIYLPLNGRYPIHDMGCCDSDSSDLPVNWIYNLEDKSWEPCDGAEEAWMMPFGVHHHAANQATRVDMKASENVSGTGS